jgi:hypothetical protein
MALLYLSSFVQMRRNFVFSSSSPFEQMFQSRNSPGCISICNNAQQKQTLTSSSDAATPRPFVALVTGTKNDWQCEFNL